MPADDVLFLDLGAGFRGVFPYANFLVAHLCFGPMSPRSDNAKILWFTRMLLEPLAHPNRRIREPSFCIRELADSARL